MILTSPIVYHGKTPLETGKFTRFRQSQQFNWQVEIPGPKTGICTRSIGTNFALYSMQVVSPAPGNSTGWCLCQLVELPGHVPTLVKSPAAAATAATRRRCLVFLPAMTYCCLVRFRYSCGLTDSLRLFPCVTGKHLAIILNLMVKGPYPKSTARDRRYEVNAYKTCRHTLAVTHAWQFFTCHYAEHTRLD